MSDSTSLPPSPVESPPASPCPANADPCDDARKHLHALAQQIMRHHSRRLLIDYLRLRRSLRTA